MRRLFYVILILLAVSSASMAQNSTAVYQIIRNDIPATITPGERVMGHFFLKCISKGNPVVNMPSLKAKRGNIDFTPLPDRMIPWIYYEDSLSDKKEIEQTVTLDVPITLPSGNAELRFGIYGDGGQSADLLDASGKNLGKTAIFNCKVLPKSTDKAPYVVGKITRPILDGQIFDKEWADAGIISTLLSNSDGSPAAADTKILLGHDDNNLYIGIIASEPNMQNVSAKIMENRDSATNLNESMELFIDPTGNRISYYHFIPDIMGQKYEAFGNDPFGYNLEWQVETHKGDNFWSQEIAIPFASLAAKTPNPGDFFLVNFARQRYAAGKSETYAITPTHGSLASTASFSPIVFDSLKEYLKNSSATLTKEYDTWPQSTKISSAKWYSKLTALDSKLNATTTVDEDAYSELSSSLSTLKEEIEPYRIKAIAALSGGSPFYATRSLPYQKFYGKNSILDTKLDKVELNLLKDEWEDVAINVTNISDKSMVIRLSTRYGADDDCIRQGLLGLTTIWQEAIPVASKDGESTYDAIVPATAGVFTIPAGETKQYWLSVHVPKDYSKGSTVTGKIRIETVDGTGGKSALFPITVNILPQVITAKTYVHGFTWNVINPELLTENPEWIQAHYSDLKAHGVDTFLIHNLSTVPRPQAKADGTLLPMDFSNLNRTINATGDKFTTYYITMDVWETIWLRKDLFGLDFPSDAYEKAFKSWIKAIVKNLKSHKIGYDRFYMNPFDESVNDNCFLLAKWIKEADPRIRTVLDSIGSTDVVEKFSKYNDLWVPHFTSYQPNENQPAINLMRKEGKDLWVYWYSEGPNEKKQDPTTEYLYKFWWALKNGVTGVGYWAQQYYGDPWNRVEASPIYDTSLVYETETGCIPSRRWQAWRQGVQDYTVLSLAKEKLQKNKDTEKIDILNNLINQAVSYPSNTSNFDAARAFAKNVLANK